MAWSAKTGQPLSLTWTFKPLPIPQGNQPLWVATGQISQASQPVGRESQTAAASPEKLAALIESSTDFIALADMDGQLIFVNECGRQLVGLENLQTVAADNHC